MKRLVLHIGTAKTGTTTLQRFLHSNRHRLLVDGWTLPTSLGAPDQRRLPVLCNDDSFVDAFMRRHGLVEASARTVARTQWTRDFAKEVATASTSNMVISSEHLSSRLFTPSEMDRLRRFLAPHFETIDVLVYLRDPVSAALSMISTQVQVDDTKGTLPPPPTTWGEGNDRSWISVCDHRQTLQRWEATFPGRLTVRLFEPESLVEGSILTDFRSFLGIDAIPDYVEPARANESLGATGIALLAALNRRIPAFADGNPSPTRRDLSDWVVRHLGSRSKLQVSGAQREAYDAAFAESNEWVRANYFPERTSLFTPPSPDGIHAPPACLDEDIDAIADLVAELWQSRTVPDTQTGLLARLGRKLRTLRKG